MLSLKKRSIMVYFILVHIYSKKKSALQVVAIIRFGLNVFVLFVRIYVGNCVCI